MLREDPVFKGIKHLLDFWHLIKGINHDLREVAISKNNNCIIILGFEEKELLECESLEAQNN